MSDVSRGHEFTPQSDQRKIATRLEVLKRDIFSTAMLAAMAGRPVAPGQRLATTEEAQGRQWLVEYWASAGTLAAKVIIEALDDDTQTKRPVATPYEFIDVAPTKTLAQAKEYKHDPKTNETSTQSEPRSLHVEELVYLDHVSTELLGRVLARPTIDLT